MSKAFQKAKFYQNPTSVSGSKPTYRKSSHSGSAVLKPVFLSKGRDLGM